MDICLFHAEYLVFGPLQQKSADLWGGIKTGDVLVLEKETDFGLTLNRTKTTAKKPFPTKRP